MRKIIRKINKRLMTGVFAFGVVLYLLSCSSTSASSSSPSLSVNDIDGATGSGFYDRASFNSVRAGQ